MTAGMTRWWRSAASAEAFARRAVRAAWRRRRRTWWTRPWRCRQGVRQARTVHRTVRVRAHKATSRPMRAVEVPRCRVVHGGGRSALATNRPTAAVGNPCLARCAWSAANLTPRCLHVEGVNRLPCPCGDCLLRLPLEGPSETRSPQGAGRPRRAPRCSATPSKLERLFMSFPPRLPTRTVIPQLQGVCP